MSVSALQGSVTLRLCIARCALTDLMWRARKGYALFTSAASTATSTSIHRSTTRKVREVWLWGGERWCSASLRSSEIYPRCHGNQARDSPEHSYAPTNSWSLRRHAGEGPIRESAMAAGSSRVGGLGLRFHCRTTLLQLPCVQPAMDHSRV